jgi:diadenosine tetraphosphatase ApaH/serine/threonine PP2A family protein phosphatase
MPLVAVLDDRIFCVHGGISPSAKSLSQLRKIKRPIVTSEVEFVSDLVWSDPCQDCKTVDESARGTGVQFGVRALQEFLGAMNLAQLIRAHQCVASGIGRFGEDLLYTVFSCSRYEGQFNRCGLMFIDLHLEIELFSLPPIEQIPRAEAKLEPFVPAEDDQEMEISNSLTMNAKLFAGPPRWKWTQRTQTLMRKENVLQNFQKVTPMMTSRFTPLIPIEIPARAALAVRKRARLPSLGEEPAGEV